jgi:hypothetical protein
MHITYHDIIDSRTIPNSAYWSQRWIPLQLASARWTLHMNKLSSRSRRFRTKFQLQWIRLRIRIRRHEIQTHFGWLEIRYSVPISSTTLSDSSGILSNEKLADFLHCKILPTPGAEMWTIIQTASTCELTAGFKCHGTSRDIFYSSHPLSWQLEGPREHNGDLPPNNIWGHSAAGRLKTSLILRCNCRAWNIL